MRAVNRQPWFPRERLAETIGKQNLQHRHQTTQQDVALQHATAKNEHEQRLRNPCEIKRRYWQIGCDKLQNGPGVPTNRPTYGLETIIARERREYDTDSKSNHAKENPNRVLGTPDMLKTAPEPQSMRFALRTGQHHQN